MNIIKEKREYFNKNEENADTLLTTPKLMLANHLSHIFYLPSVEEEKKTRMHMHCFWRSHLAVKKYVPFWTIF